LGAQTRLSGFFLPPDDPLWRVFVASVPTVHPAHVMRIEPLTDSLSRMIAPITPRLHERDEQQRYKGNNKAYR
jgi:hypothetical protein